jgi:hypothetical protein
MNEAVEEKYQPTSQKYTRNAVKLIKQGILMACLDELWLSRWLTTS